MILTPSHEALARAVEILREGGLVAYPTETVYGLAADPFSECALRNLFEAKGRPEANPVLVIVSDRAQLEGLVREVSDEARLLMERFWPGPLSLLLPRAQRVPDLLTSGSDKVCVRCPAHETARALCAAFGGPLTSTSANLSGHAPAQTIGDAMLPGVALGIDAGTLPHSRPSTIYDPETRRVLRDGAIDRAALDAR